jgi:sulfur relay (sulfurtransferase) complex TusBCD TusD component (DsrE family)
MTGTAELYLRPAGMMTQETATGCQLSLQASRSAVNDHRLAIRLCLACEVQRGTTTIALDNAKWAGG